MAPPRGYGSITGGKDDGRSDKSLRLSIKKRTEGICKKAYELATLCDVELALVCYPSDAAEPITWPPDRSKIEDAIHHYFQTPAHKKLPKNQITLKNSNPGAKITLENPNPGAKSEEEADRLRIPFPDDEDKLRELEGILESRLEAVRKMIVVRRKEGRRDSRPGDPGKQLAIAAASAVDGEIWGKRLPGIALRFPDWGMRISRPRPPPVPAWASNSWYPCPCCYCPIHIHLFTGSPGLPVVDGSQVEDFASF